MKIFLVLLSSIPCTQESLRHGCIETLHVTYPINMGSRDWLKKKTKQNPWLGSGGGSSSLSHTDSTKARRLLTVSTPTFGGRIEVKYLSLWRDNPVCLTFLYFFMSTGSFMLPIWGEVLVSFIPPWYLFFFFLFLKFHYQKVERQKRTQKRTWEHIPVSTFLLRNKGQKLHVDRTIVINVHKYMTMQIIWDWRLFV